MRVISIGEILWDVFPERELLGGAALNFCANLHRLGDEAHLLTAVGTDERGQRATAAMAALGLRTELVQVTDSYATGAAFISTNPRGEAAFSIPRPAAFDAVTLTPELMGHLQGMQFDWLYFGTLLQMAPRIEQYAHELARSLPGVRRFYDVNLRTGHWNFALVERLCRLASVVKLNDAEAEELFRLANGPGAVFTLESFCSAWAAAYEIDLLCVTLGEAGCFVYSKGLTLTSPGYSVTVKDTVGAGDAFAAAFLHGYHHGWPMQRTMTFANALGALVAGRAGATPEWRIEECEQLAASKR